MSSILEALKKLEDEKAARRSGAGNIAGKVVKAGRRPRQRPWWLLPVAMVAVAASAVLATYLLMGGLNLRREATRPAPAPSSRPAEQAAAPATLQPPLLSPYAAPSGPLPAKWKTVILPPPSPAVPPDQRPVPSGSSPQKQAEPRTAEVPAAPPQPVPAAAIPSLNVSGIAWQREGAVRFAMVNGRSVAEKEMVDGARVEEIFPDKVRFSFANRTFEVFLGKTSGENQ
jgi:general secretion pathway protein B